MEFFGEGGGVGLRIQQNPIRGAGRAPFQGVEEAGERMAGGEQGAVGHHGVIQGKEGVPDHRHPAQAGEGPEHEDVEQAEIADEDGVVAGEAQIAQDEPGIGGEPAQEEAEPVEGGETALVLDAGPDRRVTHQHLGAGFPQAAEEDAIARLAEVERPPEDHPHDGSGGSSRRTLWSSISSRRRLTEIRSAITPTRIDMKPKVSSTPPRTSDWILPPPSPCR